MRAFFWSIDKMDRAIVYVAETPNDFDILNTNLNAYIGISKLASVLLGTATQLHGLACTPTSPASLSVNIAPGQIYQFAAIDTAGYGSVAPNATQILKQGINLNTTVTTAMTAPVTSGNSINYLIEFQYQQVDTGSQVLPYYNSTNPAQTYAGPGNDGQPQNITRSNIVAYQIKAGTSAPTGTQVTPTPDSGWVGAWVITIAQGQTTITSSNIAAYPGAPFLPGFNNYAVSTTSPNTYTASLTPGPTIYAAGMMVLVNFTNTNTGAATLNINSLGAINIKNTDGSSLNAGDINAGAVSILIYDGTNFELINPNLQSALQNGSYTYATSSSAANTYSATLAHPPAAYTAGLTALIKFTNANTGAATINLNSLGAKNIKHLDGSALNSGDIASGMIALLIYDGTNFQLVGLNPANYVTQTQHQNDTPTYAASTTAANTYTATLSPAPTAYTAGMRVSILFTNANTGAATINLNSLGAISITKNSGVALQAGMISAGMFAILVYDGTQFQLANPGITITSINVQTFTSSGTYTPTPGMKYCYARCVAGGGSGGSIATNTSQTSCSGGGGSGGYAAGFFTAATIGSSQTVTIGSGGAAAATGNHNGNNGTGTSLGSLLVTTGGGGGTAGTAGSSINGVNGGSAGGASAGTIQSAGQAGTLGLTFSGSSGFGQPGAGGSSLMGIGGIFQGQVNGNGVAGGNYGAGGWCFCIQYNNKLFWWRWGKWFYGNYRIYWLLRISVYLFSICHIKILHHFLRYFQNYIWHIKSN